MVTLILERHGQSKANEMGVFTGHLDIDMTPLGYKQAERSAEYIVQNFKVDKIYSSDLVRAMGTAKCVADRLGIEVIKEKGLRELFAGKWEGATFDSIIKGYADDWKIWCEDIGNSRCTGGESVKELGERVLSVLTKIAKENDGKTILVSTHATPIRTMQCLLNKKPLDQMKNVPWGSNASVTVVEYDNEKWEIKSASYDKHLEDMKTRLPSNV